MSNEPEAMKSKLLSDIGARSLVIWGARMTGIGFARFAKAQALEILGFVDSDVAMHGQLIGGIEVRGPDFLKTLRDSGQTFVIVLAVSIKEDEIKAKISEFGLADTAVISYSNYCDVFYTIDVVGTCNLKCPSCVHSIADNSVPKGIMPFDVFKQVVKKIKREARLLTHVGLYNWGEPFLHPEIARIIDYLHESDIAVAVSSNLSIRFEDRLSDAIKVSPDYLKVSLSGYYPSAYNNTHAGGDVNLVKSNLYRLRYLIDRHKSDTFVDVNYHLYRDNNGKNLHKMRELCDELGFMLSTVNALVMPLERVIAYLDGKPDPDTQILNQNLLVNIREGIDASAGVKLSGCPYRDNQVNINSDLTVPICCTVGDPKETTVVKNFLEASPEEVLQGKQRIKICDKCMSLGLPEYNMGYNRAKWDEIARNKSSTDEG